MQSDVQAILFGHDQTQSLSPIYATSAYEDWVFWVKIALKEKRFSHIEKTCAFYRIHNSNFTSDYKNNALNFTRAMFYIYDKIPKEYQQQFIEKNINFVLNNYSNQKIFYDIYHSPTWKVAKVLALPLKILPHSILKKLKMTSK